MQGLLPCVPHSPNGQIQLVLGPMFSGKTSEMLRRLRVLSVAKRSTVLIKYVNDKRYSDDDLASTHDKVMYPAISAARLEDVREEVAAFDVVGIDEGQFFPELVSFCESLANSGKTVIVAALDGTYQRRAFGNVLHLIPLAEHICKLSAVCMRCQSAASFTSRVGSAQQVELIGGTEAGYLSTCRSCFRQLLKEQAGSSSSSSSSSSSGGASVEPDA